MPRTASYLLSWVGMAGLEWTWCMTVTTVLILQGWVNKFMEEPTIGRKRIQLAQAMWHHTYTNIPGHDEDLDAGRIIDLQKMQMA
jgi:hypothetical protein